MNVVKGVDEDGKLQTVSPTQNSSGDFMRVDKNSDLFSNFFSNFFRKLQETEGFDFFKSDVAYLGTDEAGIRSLRQELLSCTVENKTKVDRLQEFYASIGRKDDFNRI